MATKEQIKFKIALLEISDNVGPHHQKDLFDQILDDINNLNKDQGFTVNIHCEGKLIDNQLDLEKLIETPIVVTRETEKKEEPEA